MKLSIELLLDNAPFSPEPRPEIARILRLYADRMDAGGNLQATLRHQDGTTAGFARTVESE